MNRTSGRHVQRRALAAMPGTVDGCMTSLCISLMTTQTANLQQKVLGCTRGRSARGRELPWRAAAPGFKRTPQQGADIVARIARYGQTDFGRIEIQAPEASNQTVKQRTGLHVAHRLQHYRPASFPQGQARRHYLIYPDIHIQHRGALSDRNCGATPTRAAMCIHCFSIEFPIR